LEVIIGRLIKIVISSHHKLIDIALIN